MPGKGDTKNCGFLDCTAEDGPVLSQLQHAARSNQEDLKGSHRESADDCG